MFIFPVEGITRKRVADVLLMQVSWRSSLSHPSRLEFVVEQALDLRREDFGSLVVLLVAFDVGRALTEPSLEVGIVVEWCSNVLLREQTELIRFAEWYIRNINSHYDGRQRSQNWEISDGQMLAAEPLASLEKLFHETESFVNLFSLIVRDFRLAQEERWKLFSKVGKWEIYENRHNVKRFVLAKGLSL